MLLVTLSRGESWGLGDRLSRNSFVLGGQRVVLCRSSLVSIMPDERRGEPSFKYFYLSKVSNQNLNS